MTILKIRLIRIGAKHSGSVRVSHPAALGSNFGVVTLEFLAKFIVVLQGNMLVEQSLRSDLEGLAMLDRTLYCLISTLHYLVTMQQLMSHRWEDKV